MLSVQQVPDWLWLAGAAVLLLVVGLTSRGALLAASRRARGSDNMLRRLLAVIALPLAFALPLLLLNIALGAAPLEGGWVRVTRHILVLLLIAAVVWTLLRAISAVERRVLGIYSIEAADNLAARRIHTQARVLSRTLMTLVVILGVAGGLLTIPGMRQVGAGLLASAGLAGLIAGFAAQPVLGNLIAGLQIALAQPIRIDDVVIVDGEWGRIEEITGTYIVVAIWDERRLVVPLRWFIENPFQNWTRRSAQLLAPVILWLDYRTPLGPVRREFERLCAESDKWDGRVRAVQVVECGERSMQVRLLTSAANSGDAFGLRCEVREGILDFLQAKYPEALPVLRTRPEAAQDGHEEAPTRGSGQRNEVARSRAEAGWQPPMEEAAASRAVSRPAPAKAIRS